MNSVQSRIRAFEMAIRESQAFEENEDPSSTLADIEALTPALAEAAQAIYDRWDMTDVDTYANGGICHLIADRLSSVLWDHGIETTGILRL